MKIITGVIIFLLACVFNNVRSLNILLLEGFPSPSHHIWNRALIMNLVERGHNITVLTVEKDESEKNLHFIQMEGIYEVIDSEWFGLKPVDYSRRFEFLTIKEIYDYHIFVSKQLVKTHGFAELRNYPNNFPFHAIIHDFTSAQVLLGFCDKFNNPPLISVSPFGTPPHTYAVSGIDIVPSYVPHYTTTFDIDMNYLERFRNTAVYVFDWIYRRFFYMKIQNFVAKKYFGPGTTSLEILEQNSTLVLVNSDPALDYSISYPPLVKQVGGVQTKRKEKLTPRLDLILEKAKGDAFFISLGANMKSDFLGQDKIDAFVEAFRSLPEYTFIWRFDSPDRIKEAPTNLHLLDWVPQNALLNQPKVKAFITNGGMLSLQEAAWYNKPVIGIPLYWDQHQNIERIVRENAGIKLDIEELSPEKIVAAIEEIFDEKYSLGQEIRSIRLGTNVAHPADMAGYWIEQIAFLGGAPHFSHPPAHMNFIKAHLLDVWNVVIGAMLLYVYILYRNIKAFRKPKLVKEEGKKEDKTVKKTSKKNN